MNLKSNRGVTLADISISIMIIFLFSSLVTGLVYNYSTSTKAIDRKTEATQYAITVIEELKQIKYEDISSALALENYEDKEIEYYEDENEIYYTLGIEQLNKIPDEKRLENQILYRNGYNVEIKLQRYEHTDGNSDKEGDLIIIATVTVEYKVGNQVKDVELTTLLVKEIS